MTNLILHRAVAHQCQRLTTPACYQQPEVHVFFEVERPERAQAVLHHLLATAWGCTADQVDSYNLWTEAELLHNSCLHHSAGDARLLESGWNHGPLFCCPTRTLMFVRPLTQLRLIDALTRARPLQVQQQAAAGMAFGSPQRPARRHSDVQARAEFEGLSAMGGAC